MDNSKKKQRGKSTTKEIAEQAHKACHMPNNKNGPDLDKGGESGRSGISDLA